jgi:hypothetical protein
MNKKILQERKLLREQMNKHAQECQEQWKKDSEQLRKDAAKCQRQWDNIDRWATGREMSSVDDDYDIFCRDYWQPYEPIVDPFERSKFLRRG